MSWPEFSFLDGWLWPVNCVTLFLYSLSSIKAVSDSYFCFALFSLCLFFVSYGPTDPVLVVVILPVLEGVHWHFSDSVNIRLVGGLKNFLSLLNRGVVFVFYVYDWAVIVCDVYSFIYVIFCLGNIYCLHHHRVCLKIIAFKLINFDYAAIIVRK